MRLPKLAYIAGRLTAETTQEIQENIQRAEMVAGMVMEAGDGDWGSYCPHSATEGTHSVCQRFQWRGSGLSDDIWYKVTLSILSKCDGMIVLPGFAESEGTQGEILFAKDNGIPYSILQPPTMEPECFTLLQVRKALSDIENQILDRGV